MRTNPNIHGLSLLPLVSILELWGSATSSLLSRDVNNGRKNKKQRQAMKMTQICRETEGKGRFQQYIAETLL